SREASRSGCSRARSRRRRTRSRRSSPQVAAERGAGTTRHVKDALVVIDAINDFTHEDGGRLLASFRERLPAMRDALARARADGVPVVYANDHHGRWDGDARGLLEEAL